MKTMIRLIALVAALVGSQLCMAQAPAGAPAGATAICNDGTYFTGATKQGGCRGHQGIKTWFGAAAAAPAKAPAAQPAAAPSGAAPAGATAICNDGTYFMGATKQGGCRGHQGIKTWFGSTAAAPVAAAAPKPAPAPVAAAPALTPAPTSAPTPAPAPRASSSAAPVAPGGGNGQVWVNTASNVYHCPGTQWYGKTKAGSYMTEDQAKAKGARADHGKPCK